MKICLGPKKCWNPKKCLGLKKKFVSEKCWGLNFFLDMKEMLFQKVWLRKIPARKILLEKDRVNLGEGIGLRWGG